MGICQGCRNDTDSTFKIIMNGDTYVFDCFECAIHLLAPKCASCGCLIIGHGVESDKGIFCCAHCAVMAGVEGAHVRV